VGLQPERARKRLPFQEAVQLGDGKRRVAPKEQGESSSGDSICSPATETAARIWNEDWCRDIVVMTFAKSIEEGQRVVTQALELPLSAVGVSLTELSMLRIGCF
jgi:hypothetical protein